MEAKHPAQKAQDALIEAQARFDRQTKLIAEGSIPAPEDVTKSPAYLALVDARRAAAFFQIGCAAMDDTAQINTTLTEGLRTLQVEGLALADWIEWAGGDCPLAHGTAVQVKTRDGRVHTTNAYFDGPAARTQWTHINWDCDIVAYRVLAQPRPVPCDLITQSLLSMNCLGSVA